MLTPELIGKRGVTRDVAGVRIEWRLGRRERRGAAQWDALSVRWQYQRMSFWVTPCTECGQQPRLPERQLRDLLLAFVY